MIDRDIRIFVDFNGQIWVVEDEQEEGEAATEPDSGFPLAGVVAFFVAVLFIIAVWTGMIVAP